MYAYSSVKNQRRRQTRHQPRGSSVKKIQSIIISNSFPLHPLTYHDLAIVHQDILVLDVPVDDTASVKIGQSVGYLIEKVEEELSPLLLCMAGICTCEDVELRLEMSIRLVRDSTPRFARLVTYF